VAQRSSSAAPARSRVANNKPDSRGKAASPTEKQARRGKSLPSETEWDDPRFFDERTKRDILAVVFALLAIIVFVAAVIPSDALVTSLVSGFLHLVFGIGAYILPIVFLIIGASFLIRFARTHVISRVAIGLSLIFISILVLLALFTPDATEDISLLFEPFNLAMRGGYIGAGIAWAGLTLFGPLVSSIIVGGFIIAGIIIIGFSFSKLVERLQERHHLGSDTKAPFDTAPRPARIKRQKARGQDRDDGDWASGASTRVLPKEKKEKKEKNEKKSRPLSSLFKGKTPPAEAPPVEPVRSEALAGLGQGTQIQKQKQSLTRKLGRKHEGQEGKAPKAAIPLPRASSSAPARLVPPKPQASFKLPDKKLLFRSSGKASGATTAGELRKTAACLQETLEDFGILAQVVGWVAGPTVTLFKVDLPSGVRVSRVTALEDDIALALAAPGVRIFAPIPGTNYVGIEVPNKTRRNVLLGDVLPHAGSGPLELAVGMDVEGRPIVGDLAKMPHLLIGGTTGSGKSVSINAMVMSILMRATPAEVRLVMIDPKRVEFTPYNGIPHLYVPVVTEPREAASALAWGVAEMERRLKVFSAVGARNIAQYNTKVQQQVLDDEQACEMPYIVIVIDELSDLMMNVGKEVEYSISRIAQLARAAGIHLIVATQRPSTNVVTGLIKANITNRIAFNVASGIDSRVVLDTPGAENLIGLGDLLFSKPEFAKPQRIQGCFVSEDEINAVVDHLKSQGEPEYHSEILKTNLITLGAQGSDGFGNGAVAGDDPLIWEAAEIVVSTGLGSTSNIQRRLKVGYSRAGRIMDMLEEKGVVGPPNGSKPREVLVDDIELETLKAFEGRDTSGVQSFTEE